MNVGDYVQRTVNIKNRIGEPLEASSKKGQLAALRRFFSDCQEWEWLAPSFRSTARADLVVQRLAQ
jgi:hypothetical protein